MYPKYVIFIALRLYSFRHFHNHKIDHILFILNIARSTLYQWIKFYSSDPSFTDPLFIHNNQRQIKNVIRKHKISDTCKHYIINYMANNPTFNMKKLRKNVSDIFLINVSKSTIYRLFKSLNLTYKTVTTNKYNKSNIILEEQKQNLQQQITNVRKNIISLDETSIELGLRQTKGWSKKGTKCVRSLTVKRQRYSLCLAINKTKIIGYELIKGSFNGESFNTFITQKIFPKSKKASFLMDNARIHHYHKFVSQIKEHNKNIIYNIPYCPQFNPIEYVFNVLKAVS